jgi:hypothetical protein
MKGNRNKSPVESSGSKRPFKSSKADEKKEIVYAMPAKPLDFSFKDLKSFEDLRKCEPRNGVRKSIEDIEKEEKDKENSNNLRTEKPMSHTLFDEETTERFDKKGKKETKQEANDVVEGRIHADKVVENKGGKLVKKEEEKLDNVPKKKVKYLQYNNSIVLHSNYIKSFRNIHNVLFEILPEVDFLLNKTKIDLIQWIDISHNRLEDIHSDILNLPFLKILYCHANSIKEIEKVLVLGRCKSLLNLTLHGNPIEQIKGYRHYIIEIVPMLEKLDFTLVSEKELDIIHHRGSRYGERRNKQGQVIEYPKLDKEILDRMKMPKDDLGDKKDDN